ERIFGRRRAEVVGRALADMLVPASLREQHREGLRRYLDTGENRILGKRVEVIGLRADGSEFPAEVAVARIESDGPPMFTGYIRDLTERNRAADALLRSERRFRRLAESGIMGVVLSDTAGNIHEVND